MKVPFYGHVKQYENIKDEIDAKIEQVLMSGKYVQGPMLAAFEDQARDYFGSQYAVGVGNGTDAIWLSLMALGIGPGDEVITHANTFFATVEAIWIVGAKAVIVDYVELDKSRMLGLCEAVQDTIEGSIAVNEQLHAIAFKERRMGELFHRLVVRYPFQGLDGERPEFFSHFGHELLNLSLAFLPCLYVALETTASEHPVHGYREVGEGDQ